VNKRYDRRPRNRFTNDIRIAWMDGSEKDLAQASAGKFACHIGFFGVGCWVFHAVVPGDGAVFYRDDEAHLVGWMLSWDLFVLAARVGNV